MKILKDTEVLAICDTSFLLRKTYLKNFLYPVIVKIVVSKSCFLLVTCFIWVGR